MSTRAVGWAFEAQVRSPTDKLVLVKLADNANDEGLCWPSLSTIARHTCLSRDTVKRAISRLEKAGWLTVERRRQDGVHLPSIYHLAIPEGWGRSAGGRCTVHPLGAQRTPNHVTPLEPSDQKYSISDLQTQCPSGTESSAQRSSTSDLRAHLPTRDEPPYEEIIRLYETVLPELPRVIKLTDTRKRHIRARWRDDLKSLDDWEWYFRKVRASRFLMGKGPARDGRPPFKADLDWLIRESNAVKVAEGKYS